LSLDALFIASRFLHYLGVLWLFGAPLYALYGGALRNSDNISTARTIRRQLSLALALALLGGAAWFLVATAQMAGELAALRDPATWRAIFTATMFGPLWAIRIAALTVLVFVLPKWPAPRANAILLFVSCAALLSLAGTGHTQVDEGWRAWVHVAADALHLAAASAWLGGLTVLFVVLRSGPDAHAQDLAARFSGFGYLAVGTLVATGIANGLFLINSFSALFHSSYGQALLLKLALFGFMLTLAAINRAYLVPALRSDQAGAGIQRLRRNVFLEQALGAAVIAVVSVLGTLAPAPS
jgi:putative copper resistance protein D